MISYRKSYQDQTYLSIGASVAKYHLPGVWHLQPVIVTLAALLIFSDMKEVGFFRQAALRIEYHRYCCGENVRWSVQEIRPVVSLDMCCAPRVILR